MREAYQEPIRSRRMTSSASLGTRFMNVLTGPGARKLLGAGAASVAALSLLLAVPGGREQLAISFSQQPVGYTELYFTGKRDDLVAGPDGRPTVVVTFAIVNNGDPYGPDYTYRVRVRGPAGLPISETTERLVIASGERRELTVALAISDPTTWSAVDVSLAGRPEYIQDFAPIGGP